MIRILIFTLILFSLTGCATSPISMNYAPSSLLKLNGNLNISKFKYKPFLDKKVDENEIRKTTVGSFLIENSISNFIENAIKLEFRFMGADINTPSINTLEGEIIDFLFDDLGFSVDTTLSINYILNKNNKTCFQRIIKTKRTAAKFINPTGFVAEVIKNNIEDLAQSQELINCLNSK